MRTINPESATPRELDYLLAKANVANVWWDGDLPFDNTSDCVDPTFSPSTNWAQGGPLLEKYTVLVSRAVDCFLANTNKYWWSEEDGGTDERCDVCVVGRGYLDAGMRCLTRAIYGATAQVPEEFSK